MNQNGSGCTCNDFVDPKGYGKCEKKSPLKGHFPFVNSFSCYVNLPSTCPDIITSKKYPGQKISAEACKKYPNTFGKELYLKIQRYYYNELVLIFIGRVSPGFIRSERGKYCETDISNILKEFSPPSSQENNYTYRARNECEEYCLAHEACWGCSVDCKFQCHWNAISKCDALTDWTGLINGDVTQKPGKMDKFYV